MKASRDDVRFWTRFVLAALAGWRVSHMVSREDGPGNVLANLRARLGSGALGNLMDCFQCTSVWVAAPLTLFVTRRAGDLVPTWLALSGAACGLERLLAEAAPAAEDEESERGGQTDGVLRSEAVGAPRPYAAAERQGTIR
jgi:Protein of unknown function (DUF1360)